jgi:hypothetical protein
VTEPTGNAEIVQKIIARWKSDPLLFVSEAFPWGKPGSLLLEVGPDTWQIDVLRRIRDGLSPQKALLISIASGHGVGKSALVSWIILWSMLTCVDAKGIVTANTEVQLKTKTWAEVAKWFRMCGVLGMIFQMSATGLMAKERERTWRVDQVPWSETRTEAFAGMHNKGRRVILIFDEASAIPDTIWEVSEGALTDEDTEIIWLVCGNPTRNTGRFRECFGRFRNRWQNIVVDSRTARLTNKEEIQRWIESYGEDSDFVRVRVKGEFPRAGDMQFIPSDVVVEATKREAMSSIMDPLIMGVDVARFGDDQSVIFFRRGRDARTIPPIKLRGVDTMTLAARVADENLRYNPDAIFIDEGGVGGGVVDRCRYLKLPSTGINFGARADRALTGDEGLWVYANKRAEMWGVMREWLKNGSIENDIELVADLTGVEYGYKFERQSGRDAIILEAKEDMKKRGLASPDLADALALTFALPVGRSNHAEQITGRVGQGTVSPDHDPFAHLFRDPT